MTGRDLIIYILQNNLEDTPVYSNGKLIGFMDVNEAAVKFNVGPATIIAFAEKEIIPSIKIGDMIYIPANLKKYNKKEE